MKRELGGMGEWSESLSQTYDSPTGLCYFGLNIQNNTVIFEVDKEQYITTTTTTTSTTSS